MLVLKSPRDGSSHRSTHATTTIIIFSTCIFAWLCVSNVVLTKSSKESKHTKNLCKEFQVHHHLYALVLLHMLPLNKMPPLLPMDSATSLTASTTNSRRPCIHLHHHVLPLLPSAHSRGSMITIHKYCAWTTKKIPVTMIKVETCIQLKIRILML